MDVAPTITAPPISQAFTLGEIANITCVATGQPAPTYQWFYNDQEINGEISPYLIISSIEPDDRGVYYCIVRSRAGSVESSRAQVTIEGKPISIPSIR